jgi:hypothetical protein
MNIGRETNFSKGELTMVQTTTVGLQRLVKMNIMLLFFKTSKTSFLIPPLYDTSGNSFAPLESKLLSA